MLVYTVLNMDQIDMIKYLVKFDGHIVARLFKTRRKPLEA